eukprot:4764012-Alexandrium_andersonii.AAC.1
MCIRDRDESQVVGNGLVSHCAAGRHGDGARAGCWSRNSATPTELVNAFLAGVRVGVEDVR